MKPAAIALTACVALIGLGACQREAAREVEAEREGVVAPVAEREREGGVVAPVGEREREGEREGVVTRERERVVTGEREGD